MSANADLLTRFQRGDETNRRAALNDADQDRDLAQPLSLLPFRGRGTQRYLEPGTTHCASVDMKRTTKIIEVALGFIGTGRIEKKSDYGYCGDVVSPKLNGLDFSVRRQELDENGILNPVVGEDTVDGSFQINLQGTSAAYRELGRYFLAVAELDSSEDEGFHDHFDHLRSRDGHTHLHLIVRKRDRQTRSRARKKP